MWKKIETWEECWLPIDDLTELDYNKTQIASTLMSLVRDFWIFKSLWNQDNLKNLEDSEFQPITRKSITLLDIFRLIRMPDSDIIKLLKVIIWPKFFDNNNINKEWIDHINKIMNESIDFYQNVYLKWIPKSLSNWKSYLTKDNKFEFKNTNDVLKFIRLATKDNSNTKIRQIICVLLKIWYVKWLMKRHKKLEEQDQELERLINKNILPFFSKYKDNTNKWTHFYFTKFHDISSYEWVHDEIKLYFDHRTKTWESAELKLHWNPDYDEVDSIKDYFGIEAEVSNEQDAIYLLQYIYLKILNKNWNNIIEIKNKWVVSNDTINPIKHNLDNDFLKIIDRNIWIKKQPKNHDWYKDLKIVFYLDKNKKIPIEFKIVLVNNSNETWLAHHDIYHCQRIIRSVIRDSWYDTKWHIMRIIYDTLEKNKEELIPNDMDIKDRRDQIFDYLKNSWLMTEYSISWKSESVELYTCLERWIEKSELWLEPEKSEVKIEWRRRNYQNFKKNPNFKKYFPKIK